MKTTYERFIEANNALSKCYEGISADNWSKFSQSEQAAACKVEREAVSSFLVNNQVTFTNLIKERLQVAGHK
jgi:hypothetical protein